MEYSEKLMDHFEKPRNVGSLPDDDKDVGSGTVGSPVCGDVMKLQIRVKDNVITEAKFKTFGCGSAVATASLATEYLLGKTLEEAKEIKNKCIAEDLSLPPQKVHCSVLAEDAIVGAIDDYLAKSTGLEKPNRTCCSNQDKNGNCGCAGLTQI